MNGLILPPFYSWQEFLDAAQLPSSISNGAGRDNRTACTAWAGATWEEALELARDGWHEPLEEVGLSIGALRRLAGLSGRGPVLEPFLDVTGGEVDIAAYLSGAPECMVNATVQQVSRRGKVITFLIPGSYPSTTPHREVRNRGLALAALCAGIIGAGHSVEIWSSKSGELRGDPIRSHSSVARIVSPGEPLNVGRLIFAVAHPAMLRRLWFSVWDAQPRDIARLFPPTYGSSTDRVPGNLPAEIRDPYIFPVLRPGEPHWQSLDLAMAWCRTTFTDLGLSLP
ncbi:hypothetical protein GCM10009760_13950 [Kitasatospora kazusensis]|uniref:DUF7192 domain-containing protein n=1 Tax=Kitasatospora kazusensis TaxID=407974 RepID=A0ABN2Z1P5_9ACTN